MTTKKEMFADVLLSLGYRYDLRPVFDDLLTMTLCSFSRNIGTGLSYDEDLYLETVGKYPKEVVDIFPKLLALLIQEMEERFDSVMGNDVLGEFYEQNFLRKGAAQFFTPWHVCDLLTSLSGGREVAELDRPIRIIDPTCGSGRMLLTSAKRFGPSEEYYGIDIDLTCVKMTALSLFLNGIFHGEVMCADALSPHDFRVSYRLSFLPFGIFRIQEKERSKLWHMHRNAFTNGKEAQKPVVVFREDGESQTGPASQLKLF